jgi:predicted transcriptional regulator
MADELDQSELLALTTEIVASHVSNNVVPVGDLSKLIQQVYATLASVTSPALGGGQGAERPKPAVAIKKSVMPDYLICLEDGKKLKMLKRHLMTSYGMTPEQYRERWGLPADYPMVAPSYAKRRSVLAKKIGLGTKPGGRKRA